MSGCETGWPRTGSRGGALRVGRASITINHKVTARRNNNLPPRQLYVRAKSKPYEANRCGTLPCPLRPAKLRGGKVCLVRRGFLPEAVGRFADFLFLPGLQPVSSRLQVLDLLGFGRARLIALARHLD